VIQPNYIWVTTFWAFLSLIVRPGWLVFSSGFILCLVLMYLRTPGEFWHLVGMLTFSQPRMEHYLERSVACKPAAAQPYLKLGLLQYQRREWSKAIPLLEEAATRRRGKCPPKRREWSKAIPLLEEAATRRRGKCPPSLQIMLATAYRENHQDRLAIPLLQGMIDQGARPAEVYYNLALCFLRIQDTRSALDAAKEAHALDPNAVRPVMIMGSMYFALKDFAMAQKNYQWLISVLPKPAESLYWLGRIELELGEIQAAAAHLQLAVDRIGQHRDLSSVPLEDVRHWLARANGLRPDTPASPLVCPSA